MRGEPTALPRRSGATIDGETNALLGACFSGGRHYRGCARLRRHCWRIGGAGKDPVFHFSRLPDHLASCRDFPASVTDRASTLETAPLKRFPAAAGQRSAMEGGPAELFEDPALALALVSGLRTQPEERWQ